MKKEYISPKLEVITLHASDIITASGGPGQNAGEEDEFNDWR